MTAVLAPAALAQATARADRIRTGLMAVHAELIDAWTSRDHTALGYGSWKAYCAAEFGALLNVLPTAEQLGAMADAGMPQRAIAAPFGVSLGKVNGVLKARRSPAPAPAAPDGETRAAQVVRLVAAAGPKGLTSPELMRRARCSYGAASGALSRLARSGRVAPSGQFRNGYGAYVATVTR